MVKCSHVTTDAALMKCAGYNYFKYLMDFINQHYILYDGGMEGIRNGFLENSDRACFYHSTLSTVDFRSPFPVTRVPPPVPSSQNNDTSFHYSTLEESAVYFAITPLTRSSSKRLLVEPDIFCPRYQLLKL